MFGFTAKTEFVNKSADVVRAVDKAVFKNLSHAAASLRKYAAGLIQRAPQDEPSAPGEPPHTHRRIFYRRALRYFVDKQKQEALVGFQYSVIGDVGAVHEFGEKRGDTQFPARPTLGPTLDANASRLGSQWQGSIGA